MKLLKPTWVNHNGECAQESPEAEPEVGLGSGLGLGSHKGPASLAPDARCRVPELRNRQERTLSSALGSRRSRARALGWRRRSLSSLQALVRAPRRPPVVREGAEARLPQQAWTPVKFSHPFAPPRMCSDGSGCETQAVSPLWPFSVWGEDLESVGGTVNAFAEVRSW